MAHRHALVEPQGQLMRIVLQPSSAYLELLPRERILDDARRLGYDCPQSCRSDNCHICAALLVEGRARQNGEVCDHGELFTCLVEPLEDYVLHQDRVLAPSELPLYKLTCQLSFYEEAGGDAYRVGLRAPVGKPPYYHVGQCLLLGHDGGDSATFSLVSAPHAGYDLELHILAKESGAVALVAQLQHEYLARIRLSFDDAYLTGLPDGPLVLIAAGAGVSQMHSLIKYCRTTGFAHPVHLYWGVRRPGDFYRLPHWTEWEGLPNLFLHWVVNDLCGRKGRYGLLHGAMRKDFVDLSNLHVYTNGSPAMVYTTLGTLVEAEMDTHRMRANVFTYVPRD